MTVDELISVCNPETVSGDLPSAIGSLQQDSRKVKKGDLFIAVRGWTVDGHRFIGDAVSRGASVIISEEPLEAEAPGVTFIKVGATRPLLGKLAQKFQGSPAEKLTTIAVTGTNGKTTVATLVWQVLQALGSTAGLLGTVTKQFGDRKAESRLTTADPVELASDMRQMVEAGCTHLIMEVSSHALEQARTEGIDWHIAAFTNLSHDHLDFHKNMERYVAAKRSLFDSLKPSARAVINMDDPYGPEMKKNCRASIIDFSFTRNASTACRLVRSDLAGLAILIGEVEIETPLVGTFNAYNAAEAFLICRELGFEPQKVARALQTCRGAPGRLEKITRPEETVLKPAVFVDYAHTPDALENVLSSLKQTRTGEPLTVVFGCGGDRDRAKRTEMAKIVEARADRIVVTSDNPRSENPEAIIREIEKGFSREAEWMSLTSRKDAIRRAILDAPENGIVLIAGKGHETWQEIGGERIHFDDRKTARQFLDERNDSKKTGEVH